MPKVRAVSKSEDGSKKLRPALNPVNQENQLRSLAVDLAVKKLMDGTASSQLICQILKSTTEKDRLEVEKLENEIEHLRAKTKSVESGHRIEELYEKAMRAMKYYSGNGDSDDDDDADF